jgi:NAD(P)-dependent dehydrogenase (short-subunit alcohol dehydrogenase family)
MATTTTIPRRPLTWLITGCSRSSGLGIALARVAAASGHTIIATSRDPSKIPDLVSEIQSKGHNSKFLPLDVNNVNRCGAIIEELERDGIHVDVLVNNAGYCTFSPVETSTDAEVRAQMDTMYFGPLALIRALVPRMRDRGFGTIVNISSGASLEGNYCMGPYAGAKAALDGMSVLLECLVLCMVLQ